MLSCVYDDAFKRTLAADRKEYSYKVLLLLSINNVKVSNQLGKYFSDCK